MRIIGFWLKGTHLWIYPKGDPLPLGGPTIVSDIIRVMSSTQISLHEGQLEVASDPHRFKIICAGRRWGKSVLSRMIVLKWATADPGLYWIVSPTYKQSKQIHWRDISKEIPKGWIEKKNEVELSITLKNGSVIELKGAENPDALRGVKLKGLVIDEIASINNWEWLWSEVLRPTLTDYAAPALFISTPKGFNHFHKLYISGVGAAKNSDSVYKSWTFTSYDNPFIPKSEIDQSKKELTEDTFGQEYLAQFKSYVGLVYKTFDESIHIIKPFDIPEHWNIYRGLDFGSTNPTACLWIAVDRDDNWFVVDEYYETGQTIDYHVGMINANQFSKNVRNTWGDPSGAQWIKEFSDRGVYVTPANKELSTTYSKWVSYGIDRVQEKLKTRWGHFVEALGQKDLPTLFVFEKCVNLLREFNTYRWREKSNTQATDINEPDVPEKANDHALDALRYVAVSYQKSPFTQVKPQWRPDLWKIGK